MWASPKRRAHPFRLFARVSRIESGPLSKALALAPRALIVKVCERFTDCGRLISKMWLSPKLRAHWS
eukprot:2224051-Pyramimonas_sp.AAC.1